MDSCRGFAYQCGALLAGSVSVFEAMLAKRVSYATAMAGTAAAVFAFTMVVVMMGPERRGREFATRLP